MFCRHCGKEDPQMGDFCRYCGGTTSATVASDPMAPVQPAPSHPGAAGVSAGGAGPGIAGFVIGILTALSLFVTYNTEQELAEALVGVWALGCIGLALSAIGRSGG